MKFITISTVTLACASIAMAQVTGSALSERSLGSQNCTGQDFYESCAWEEFCGNDNRCYQYSCFNWYQHGPHEYTGRDDTEAHSELLCEDGIDPPANVSDAMKIGYQYSDVGGGGGGSSSSVSFTRECMGQYSDRRFVCYEMSNDTDLSRLNSTGLWDLGTPYFRYYIVVDVTVDFTYGSYRETETFNETLARATMHFHLSGDPSSSSSLGLLAILGAIVATIVLL